MKLYSCSVSFRHELNSLSDLMRWAQSCHLSGIELWGPHAKALLQSPSGDSNSSALSVPMISDYLPLEADEHALYEHVKGLIQCAHHFNARKIRTFAGNIAFARANAVQKTRIVKHLILASDWLAREGIQLLVEIHPNTLADSTKHTKWLLEATQGGVRINFDVLHVWEAFDAPEQSVDQLHEHIEHFHLKNVRSHDELSVFDPANVFSASGQRDAMTPLFEGAFNYQHFFNYLADRHPSLMEKDFALEWFGITPKESIRRDAYQVLRWWQQRLHTEAA